MRKTYCRFWILSVILYLLIPMVSAQQYLIPGGQIVGLELKTDRVTVAAVDELINHESCKMKPGDEILSINEKKVTGTDDLKNELIKADGKVELKVLRNGQVKIITMLPEATAYGPKLGVYLKQGISGIGTVTWIDPAQGTFGALGHGVNDKQGKLMKIIDGEVYSANIISIKKGIPGTPGQLHGTAAKTVGTLSKNTKTGVYGVMGCFADAEPIPVASWEEIKTGDATIRCTVSGEQPREYSVEILKIYPIAGEDGKNLLLRITDQDLLRNTGGIIQGMSGSPILQNGKLIGAVTHVFTNDPTKGYGIYIGNMLKA